MDAFSCSWSQEQFYAFPPFSLILRCLKKIEMEEGGRDHHCSSLANPALVSEADESFSRDAQTVSSDKRDIVSSKQAQSTTSHGGQTETNCMQVIGESLTKQGISAEATKIILKSWRKGTSKQYQSYYKKWLDFCHREQISTVRPSLAQVIEFLLTLFNNGLSYSSLNTARSALSSILPSIDGIPVGQHPLVIRFLKGVFESRPAMPRYTAVWDVHQVLDYLKTLSPVNEISLKSSSLKLTMLLALVTAQRGQSLLFLNVDSMIDSGSSIVFRLQEHVKQSKPGSKGMVIELKSFTDPRICVVTTLKEYLTRTKFARETRSCSQLLLSYVKPYGPVSRDTISRWVKFVLQSSGIDVNIFKPHSTRSASTSKAKLSDVPLADILDKGWMEVRIHLC